jgi:tetratricopeptide (TPR) repeat protein
MKSKNGKRNLRRATIFVALFFALPTWGLSGETYRDIIRKAQNLSLQKDRAQAISLLVGAMKKESKKNISAQREIAETLSQAAQVFYSDKTQQLYELALSVQASDLSAALAKLQEASRLEPDNVSIEIALARLLVASSDCGGAANRLNKFQDLFFAVEELRLLSSQISLCQGRTDKHPATKSPADQKNSGLAVFWQAIEIENLLKLGNAAKALEDAEGLHKSEPQFPEAVYWIWRSELELKRRPEKSAQKYLNLCKTLTSRQRRQYLQEPLLCRRTVEVETFLKKTNNSEI